MKGLYSRSNFTQCVLGNFQYGGDHNAGGTFTFFVIADSTWNEYEIIMLIYTPSKALDQYSIYQLIVNV